MFFVLALVRQRGRVARNRNLHVALFFLALAVPLAAATPGELLNRAAEETDGGDYDAAVRDARAAAQLYAAQGDARNRAAAINQAGLAQLYAGTYPAAAASFDEALRIAAAARDVEGEIEERMNLASVDFFTGRYADAATRYDEVARAIAAHRTEGWAARREQLLLVNRATLDQRLGRYAEALAAYQKADTNAIDPEERAQLLVNLGVLYRRMGDPYKALAAYDEARGLYASKRHLDGELGALKNRGIVLALDLKRLPEARATFADAFARASAAGDAREALQAQLYGAETALRLGDLAAAGRDFGAAYDAALKLQSVEDQWKALYGLARCEPDDRATAHLRKAVEVIEQIRESIRLPSLKSGFFNDKRQVFDALIALRLRHGANAAELFDLIERGHSRGWRERLGLRSQVDLAAVQRALPHDALLLDYWTSPAGAAVIAVTKRSATVHPIHVDANAIRTLTDELPHDGDTRAAAATLASQLLPPLPDAHDLLIVPDGALAAIPFELLPIANRPLVATRAVTYAPSATLLLRERPAVRRFASPWTPEFRGFADPLFGSAPLGDARGRLAASADEVRGIARELGGTSVLRIGADDRKQHLVERSDTPLLHIASHAFVDAGAIEQSRILFSSERAGGAATYLFLKEAYELPLQNVELAVLSACDTERGRATTGEGIESFSRAFLAAGARSTVTTLWRVPDATTASFMRLFYHHLQRGASRAEALRRAKLRFIESGGALAHPHYWAAFVLTGDGLQPVSTALRWRTIAIATIALVLIAVAIAHSSKRMRG